MAEGTRRAADRQNDDVRIKRNRETVGTEVPAVFSFPEIFLNLAGQNGRLFHLISINKISYSEQRKGDKMYSLVKRAKKRDKEAFQQLMIQQEEALFKVAKAILKNDEDAADAMQETALTCWEKIGTLEKDRYFKTWCTRILINHCYAILRQRGKEAGNEVSEQTFFQEKGYDSTEWDMLFQCLSEKYRVLILLYYVQGYKTKEIAEMLQVNESTIRGRLARAREKLEHMLKN